MLPYESLDAGWDASLDDARRLGCRYVIVPSIPGALRASLDDYRRVADKFTRARKVPRRRICDSLITITTSTLRRSTAGCPSMCCSKRPIRSSWGFELDLYWIVRSGQDPLRYFNRWPGRCKLVHVKIPGVRRSIA